MNLIFATSSSDPYPTNMSNVIHTVNTFFQALKAIIGTNRLILCDIKNIGKWYFVLSAM